MLHFTKNTPPIDLHEFIRGYWTIYNPLNKQVKIELVPDGYPELFFVLSGGVIEKVGNQPKITCTTCGFIGQINDQSRFFFLPNSEVIFIKLYPYSAKSVIGIDQCEFLNRLVPLSHLNTKKFWLNLYVELLGIDMLNQRIEYLNHELRFALTSRRPTGAIQYVAQQMLDSAGNVNLINLIKKLNVSRRHLENGFNEWIGTTPKQYANLLRVKKASTLLMDETVSYSISEIAHITGFYDQSHLTKEFKSITGNTPGRYAENSYAFPIIQRNEYLSQWDYS